MFIVHITILEKTIGSHSYTLILFKLKLKLCAAIFSILYKWTIFIKNSCLLLFLSHGIQVKKRTYSAQVRLHCVLLTKIMNKIKLVWFYSLYGNFFFLSKNVIVLYISKIFFFTTLHLKTFWEYWIILYFSEYRCV